jgi:integrase/recombinase XerD
MHRKPLAVLLNDLEQEMIRLGYSKGTMEFYRRRWQKLLQFAQERDETYYSERLGIDFVEKYFQILEKDFDGTLSQSEAQELRIIRMIGDFQLHFTILRRPINIRKSLRILTLSKLVTVLSNTVLIKNILKSQLTIM